MNKPVFHFDEDKYFFIEKGKPALVVPLNCLGWHQPLQTTSLVVSHDKETNNFETLNAKYIAQSCL